MKIMKYSYRIIRIITGLFFIGFVSCKKEQPAVEYSPIFPISGEWHTHVFEEGERIEGIFALRTYNTADNLSDIAWFRLGAVAQSFGVLAKVKVDVANKTIIAGKYQNTLAVPADKTTIEIIEGKILLNASTQPSNVVADSIYVKYKTAVDGNTYIVKGHRRTAWPQDQY